jgi:hypothetical protein
MSAGRLKEDEMRVPTFCCAENIMPVLEAGSITDPLTGVAQIPNASRNYWVG